MVFNTNNSKQHNTFNVGGNIVLVALLIVSLILVFVYTREADSGPLHNAQGAVSGAATPFKFIGGAAGSAVSHAGDSIEDMVTDESSYNALIEQNNALRAQVAQLEESRLEAERLQGLLNVKETYSLDLVTGKVIDRKSDAWNQVISVNIGSNDGVELGLAVIGSTGLIGQVIAVTPSSCDVRLLTDPKSGVAVLIQSNREQGIVRGSLEGLLYLENVDPSLSVAQGDVIMTSGMGGLYPKGIVIGTVANIESSSGTTDRKIIVTPLSSVDPLEEVAVITKMNNASDSANQSSEGE